MSVQTTADERLASARHKVQSAFEDLSEIVVDECWGTTDFRQEFRGQIQEAFDLLRQVRAKLRSP